jgi:long-chain acyl-CoA synthetase
MTPGGPPTFTQFLQSRFAEHPDKPAVISPAGSCTFGELIEAIALGGARLERDGVAPGTVVGLEGDFTPSTIALFFALLDRAAVVVPQSNAGSIGREARDEIAEIEAYYRVDDRDEVAFERTGRVAAHPLYGELRARGHPGAVAFSSGTSGEPKAALHDFTFLLERFQERRRVFSTLAFLLFDHLGGIGTMLHAYSNAATIVSTRDRSPDAVCELVERHRVELLPATPTFFNLLLLSGADRRHDLSSLRVITYGAEPMPETTLVRLAERFAGVKLQQTYGMIELGPMRSSSRGDDSPWVKVGGDGYETRVVDGILQVKTRAAIMGYLNAPSPFTDDGWLVTGDAVLQDGEYLRFLGRRSELINVGGRKVFPAEVESVILALEEVEDVTVYGEANGLIGQIVCAKVKTHAPVDQIELARRVKRHCREHLERFKVPVKVGLTESAQFGDRFKKVRGGMRDGPPDFVGVGAQRCGTTWWYSLIAAHPDVHAFQWKECHHFDEFCGRPFGEEEVRGYHARFPRPAGALAGEWTPRYAYDFWTPALLRRAAPDARLLLMVRDPVERYRSGLVHQRTQMPGAWDIDAATISDDAAQRGRYGEQLGRLRDHFPAERILVLQYERCVEDPVAELRRTHAFLGLDDRAGEVDVSAPRGTSSGEAREPLPEAIRAALVDYLRDDVRELARIAPEVEIERWPDFAARA